MLGADSSWTGDAQLEPLLKSLHTTFRGQLTERECIAHLQKAAWRLDVATLHAKLDLRDRDIKAKQQHIDELSKEVLSYTQGRSKHDDLVKANSMDIMADYVETIERQLMDSSDARAQDLMGQLGDMEAAKIARENKIEELREELSGADDRQAAACAGLEAEVAALTREVASLETLRDTNRHLQANLTELMPGGRACKMLIADANERPLAMLRSMWVFIGTDVWEERDTMLQARVADVVSAELAESQDAHVHHTRQLFQSLSRSQSLAAALAISSEVKLLEEVAADESTGPGDVQRIAHDIEALRHADEDCEDWCIKASRRLRYAEAAEAAIQKKISDMEEEMHNMEEENPGLFEQKEDDELLDDGGDGAVVGMSEEEVRGAELLRLLGTERKAHMDAVEELVAARDEVKQAQHEMARIQEALTGVSADGIARGSALASIWPRVC